MERATPFLLHPAAENWLPKGYLARFVVDIVDQLDLSSPIKQYRGAGSVAYHPADDNNSMVVVATTVTQTANDKHQIKRTLALLATLPANRQRPPAPPPSYVRVKDVGI